MQDDGLRQRSSAAGAKLSAETFVWENEARKYVAVFERGLAALRAGAVEPAGPTAG
jgi:hypothetical protein